MSQMSLREKIDEVDAQADPLDCLDELNSQSKSDKSKLIDAFQEYYIKQRWPEAKEVVLKLQFFARLQEQIKQKQETLEDQLI